MLGNTNLPQQSSAGSVGLSQESVSQAAIGNFVGLWTAASTVSEFAAAAGRVLYV